MFTYSLLVIYVLLKISQILTYNMYAL